jgi:hypothetical protein
MSKYIYTQHSGFFEVPQFAISTVGTRDNYIEGCTVPKAPEAYRPGVQQRKYESALFQTYNGNPHCPTGL